MRSKQKGVRVPRVLHLPDSTARRKPDNVRSMFTPSQFMRFARPIVDAIARSHPELEPLATALSEEIGRLFPGPVVEAGPDRPPTK